MKKIFLVVALVLPLMVNAQSKKVELKTFEDSLSYAVGCDIANGLQQLPIDYDIVTRAILDMTKGESQFTSDDVKKILNELQLRQQRNMEAEAQKNIETGKKFLAENRNNKSVYETQSGLQYKIIEQGKGNKPAVTDKVKFHYRGTLLDGTQFDSSYDRGQPLVGEVNRFIAGWVEGMQLMTEGSKYVFYIPSNLGYGNFPAGQIPPGSLLIFEVELLEIIK
ncbi:MAG: FKBP-type peptidyl-prolyl cis-trans isomerase [Bacteroidales bacterium]|nr:FKBP-type peptidyl-prolyl cis-trans isomerase [Bacteroidales bacterium]